MDIEKGGFEVVGYDEINALIDEEASADMPKVSKDIFDWVDTIVIALIAVVIIFI